MYYQATARLIMMVLVRVRIILSLIVCSQVKNVSYEGRIGEKEVVITVAIKDNSDRGNHVVQFVCIRIEPAV